MRSSGIDWPTDDWRGRDPAQWMRDHGLSLISRHDDGQLELNLSMDTLTELRRTLFVNQGWRLTRVGLRLMAGVYNSYRCTHPDNAVLTGRVLIGMDDAVGGPWGYGGKDVYVFDQIVHFELQMCEGSASRFVEFKKQG